MAKYSAGNGETYGRVTSFNFDTFEVQSYSATLNFVQFDDQIEVGTIDPNVRFSDAGDSGALVYNEAGQPVGLLFAQTEQGGVFGKGLSYVNPIRLVLCKLKVSLLTS